MPTPVNSPVERPSPDADRSALEHINLHIEQPPPDANRGILEHIAGWAVILAFWGLVSILLTFGAITDGIADFIWPGNVDRVNRLRLLIVSVKWNVRNRLRGLRAFVQQFGPFTQRRILGIIPTDLWDESSHFLGGGLPFWAFAYVRDFWIRRLRLVIDLVTLNVLCGREWLRDLARQLGTSVLQLLRGSLPAALSGVAGDIPGLDLPFCLVVYVLHFWHTRQDQYDRAASESSEDTPSGLDGLELQAVENNSPLQHEAQDADAPYVDAPHDSALEETEQDPEAPDDDDDDEPLPKVTRDRSPPPPPPPGGICYSQDFGSMPTELDKSASSRQNTTPAARTLSTSFCPHSDTSDSIRVTTPSSMQERANGPSILKHDPDCATPEDLMSSEDSSPDDRRASRTFTRFGSDTVVAESPVLNPQYSPNLDESQEDMHGASCRWPLLCPGLPCDCNKQSSTTRAASTTYQPAASSLRVYSTWSPRRLGNALGCALDDLYSRLKAPPSPVFLQKTIAPMTPPLASVVPPGMAYKGANTSNEVTSSPSSLSSSPEGSKMASMHSAKKSVSRDASENILLPRNLDGIDEESGSPPPISPRKKRNKKIALSSTPAQQEPKNSFGINHSWSGSDSGLLPGLRQETVYVARVPVEPNPIHFFGRHTSFMYNLTIPLMPICEHFSKPSTVYEPPPDLLDAMNSVIDVETTHEPSLTDRFEEAYISSLLFDEDKAINVLVADVVGDMPNVDNDDNVEATAELDPTGRELESDGDEWMTPEEKTESFKPALFQEEAIRLEIVMNHFEEHGRDAAAMSAGAGPSEIEDEFRRDSAAGKVSTPATNDLETQGPESVLESAAMQDLEWAPTTSYNDMEFDEALRSSPSSSQRTALRYRHDRDNASISTTSSERAKSSFRLNRSSRKWSPFQPKSTASVGISSGQSAMGKLSLREAVSPTRMRRRSVTDEQISNALQRSQQHTHNNDGKGKDKVTENRKPRALWGSNEETAFAIDDDGDEGSVQWSDQLRMPLGHEDLDPDLSMFRNMVDKSSGKMPMTTNREHSLNSDQSDPPRAPEIRHISPLDLNNENASPTHRRISFASPVVSIRSNPEAIDSTSGTLESSSSNTNERKSTWKHKRSNAVDLGSGAAFEGVQRRTGDTSDDSPQGKL